VKSIEFTSDEGGAILLVDQRLLPHEKKILIIKSNSELIAAIQSLAVGRTSTGSCRGIRGWLNSFTQ
jgi:methylthioribose-1-phosphate isomerase